jgi:predicted transcriptional regulator
MMFFYYALKMARKPLSTKIENDLQKEIKKLAIDLERPLNDLLEESIRDLLKKYEKQTKE